MGTQNTKNKRLNKHKLKPNEITQIIEALDGSSNIDVSKGLNADAIETFWKHELVPTLLQQYLAYLCPNTNSKCSIEEFAELFVQLVRANWEDKTTTIIRILGYKYDVKAVPYHKLVKYVSDLLESYLLGIERRKAREYLSWHGRFRNSETQSFTGVAESWCSELKSLADRNAQNAQPNEVDTSLQVLREQIQQWLVGCGVLNALHREEMKILYGLELEDDDIGMLPLLMNPEALGVTHSVLAPSYILHLNFLLPKDYQREWRFLFSTNCHGESFSMLLGKIIDKGPTVIIVSDDNNHLFGGFASTSWSLSPKFQGDVRCFLFTLNPEVKVFHPTGYNDHYMYLNNQQQSMPNGLGMGGQFNYWGLWLDANFGKGMCSDVCTTYNNYKMMSAKKEFNIKCIEVWGVGPPPLAPEEAGVRPGILDKDPTARTILEMAGKPQHSSGIREEPS